MTNPNDEHSISSAKRIDAICDRFESAWLRGERLSIETLLAENPLSIRNALSHELALLEIELRRKADEEFSVDEYASYLASDMDNDQGFNLERTAPAIDPDANVRRRLRYFGDFELTEKIASGGMGTVYRARQLSLNRLVAVKMINRGQFASKLEVKRFHSEAQAAASLDHPNIVPVYEVGEFEGDHFYSMAFVEGQSLSERIKPGPMESKLVAELMRTVARAVQYAHDRGVIHRDLKPSNILLDEHSRPRVTDFGLAKLLGATSGITISGEILGTPSFMAPEQASGRINAVGVTSDIYSLGAVLYTCVSGRPPFQAASQIATLKQVIEDEPVPLRQLNSAIPRDLETIAHKCLQKTIGRRYQSADELADDLGRFLAGQPILARPVNALEKSVRWCRRNPARAFNLAGVILFVMVVIAGRMFLQAREKEISLQGQAASAVAQLNVADESGLPLLVGQVRHFERATRLLQLQFSTAPIGSIKRYRAALGLLPGNEAVVREVCNTWLATHWSEWIFIRNQLEPRMDFVSEWVQDFDSAIVASMPESQLARWAAIRGTVADRFSDPSFELSESDWDRIASAVLQELLADPSQLTHAAQAFAPSRANLETRLASRLDFTRKEFIPDAPIAARLMAELFADNPNKLIETGSTAKSEWIPVLFEKARDDDVLRMHLLDVLDNPIQQDTWEEKISGCRKRAIAACMLFRMGETDTIFPLLDFREDTTVQSLIIDWIPAMQSAPSDLIEKARSLMSERPQRIERLRNTESKNRIPNPWLRDEHSSLLRAVLSALGNYPARVLERSVDDAFWGSVAERYEFDPDPGIHSTCEWLLRVCNRGATIDELRAKISKAGTDQEGWRVIHNGHVVAVLQGPIEYEAGSDALDPFRDEGQSTDPVDGTVQNWSEDHRHIKHIDRSFMIAMHETQLSQLHAFDPSFHLTHNKNLGPSLQHPACRVSWQLAASYCNWLSAQEGIPENEWCFDKSPEGGWQVVPDYLHRRGYRLPSEAEWEFACRAGTTTRTYFGDSEELLLKNVWFIENSKEKLLSIPGSFKCNGLGLFDSLGNVQEWCMDGFDNRNPGSRFRQADTETPLDLNMSMNRIVRGSSIYSMDYDLRASEYSNFRASYREGNTGFRIARTIPR